MGNFLARRTEFHALLEGALGSQEVYFQPDSDHHLNYPCIVYELDNASSKYANNMPYGWIPRYQVTLIDYDPDNDVKTKLAHFQNSSFNRHFATSGLNHDVFVIYH